jgi:hypothetical protein
MCMAAVHKCGDAVVKEWYVLSVSQQRICFFLNETHPTSVHGYIGNFTMNTSPTTRFTYASPPHPCLYYQLIDKKDVSVPLVPALKSSRKANVQAVAISKRPEGLHFLMTPCSLRSLLPDQTYYTKFGVCKSTNPEESKSSQRLRKVSFDLESREGPKSCDGT